MNHTETESLDWTVTLTGEILLSGLLAKIIYSDPDAAWIQTLIDEEVFSGVPLGNDAEETQSGLECFNRWIQDQNGKVTEPALLRLKSDYISLFIGPGKMFAPLWESVYFSDERLVFQAQTLSVRYWYRRFGLESERINQEPDDQIGLEFSFMAHLAMLALQAIEEKDTDKFNRFLTAQKEFFSDHLSKWGVEWAKLVIEHAQTDFYRGLGHLTLGSLQTIAQILQVEIPTKAHK